MSDFGDMIVSLLAFIAMILFIALCLGAPVMLLWNAVIATIFGLTKITFWQAIALNLLASVLFGRIKVGGNN